MAYVAKCTFREPVKSYYLDPGELELHVNTPVIAETARGLELGRVQFVPREVDENSIAGPIRAITRLATDEDIARDAANRELETECLRVFRERVRHFKLPMKPIQVEVMHDREKVWFYYEAETRVDFRELLRDLARQLRMRVQLQQVGARDAAKLLGGCGPCGQPLCCATFLTATPPVTLKFARDQNLSLTPSKISGACGRLMCCLRYEVDFYRDQSARLPTPDTPVDTPEGPGHVVEVNLVSERIVVRLGDNRHIVVSGEDLRALRQERGPVRECKNHVRHGGSCAGAAGGGCNSGGGCGKDGGCGCTYKKKPTEQLATVG
jgi:cell fate regulator YaaT (PSP1 superfamily)